MLNATTSNYDSLRLEGSLSPDSGNQSHGNIPKTIRDAMHLTVAIGLPYLWVDCLCIIQDDEQNKRQHLDAMAYIYAKANITIVAAEGPDADFGIRGSSNSSIPRNIHCTVLEISGFRLKVEDEHSHHRTMTNTVWASRGWTFQEAFFSNRMLMFDGLVSWSCATTVIEEGKTIGDESFWTSDYDNLSPIITGLGPSIFYESFPACPSMTALVSVIQEYNQRSFTYEEDVVSTFAGTATVLRSSFQREFHYGLPEMFFDIALLWQPARYFEEDSMRRRLSSGPSATVHDPLPSWSWVRWRCQLDLGAYFGCFSYFSHEVCEAQAFDEGILIYPLVKWYKSHRSGQTYWPIDTNSLSPASSSQSTRECSMPSGWSWRNWAGPADAEKLEPARIEDPKCVCFHEAFPGKLFLYPFRTTKIATENLYSGTFGPRLSCRAQCAWFMVGGCRSGKLGHAIWLSDMGGRWAGVVRLNQSNPMLQSFTPERVPVQLIAISRGLVSESNLKYGSYLNFDEVDDEQRPSNGEFYEFYNVIWIEWKNGIAYRKALGKVPKQVWESQELEEIDVVLG